jgi:cytochrome bd-type quinol oxidase subunit 2
MFATTKNYFKAQFTVKVLLEVALFLIIYSQIYPTLIEPYLETQINNSDPTTAVLLTIIPFVIACMIIIGIFSYNLKRR